MFISGAVSSAFDENGKIKGILPAGALAKKRFDMLKGMACELFPRLPLEFEYEFFSYHTSTFAGMPVIDSHPGPQNCCFAVSGGATSALAGTTAASVLWGICSGARTGSPYAMRRN